MLSQTVLMLAFFALALAQPLGEPEVRSADTTPLIVSSAAADAERSALVFSASGATGTTRVLSGVDNDSLSELECERAAADSRGVSEFVCSVANGAGVRVLVVERVDANGEVEARHRFQWTYTAPVVTSLTGGADGVPLIVGGRNFGSRDAALESGVASHVVEVFVGPFAVHSADAPCVVDDEEGTRIKCGELPIGFGTGLRVTVCVAGVCGTSDAPLFDFEEPVIEHMSVIHDRVHLFGRGFGPAEGAEAEHLVSDASLPTLKLTIGTQECVNAKVVVPGREISCDYDASLHGAADGGLVVLERRDLRAALQVRQVPTGIVILGVSPNHGPTTGAFHLTLLGDNLGEEGRQHAILIGGRQAINCVTRTRGTADPVIECDAAPAGVGRNLDVAVSDGLSTAPVGVCDACFSYDQPQISSASRPSTRGGKVMVRGSNFGPSFAPKSVLLVRDGVEVECVVERATHDKIQCDAPAGSGDHHSVEVIAGEGDAAQRSAENRAFGYARPDIHSATRPHWRGGHLYIRGRNFGVDADDVTVYIDGEECKQVAIVKSHRNLRCKAPPGRVDGTEHELKVRVRGQSSSKGGHAYHHLMYSNTPPQFAPHSSRYIAVAGDPLKIRLPAYDADGDEIYYRARGLPDGASWAQGFGFMQVEYAPPAALVEYPHTEVNVTLEVSVTDGPGYTTTLLDVQARACPAHQDACKDLSCASRAEMCPRCPRSDVVRCSARRPILDPASGACRSADQVAADAAAAPATAAPIAAAGYSFAVGQTTRLPLLAAGSGAVAGALLVTADNGLAAAAGPQPHDGALACVSIASCDASMPPAPRAASHAVHISSSGAYGDAGVQLLLPTFADAQDGYGHCLGVYDKEAHAWHCADEALRAHDGALLGGAAHRDGCYAIMADNCPDHANPAQQDTDRDGHGDHCQGGATGCADCGGYDVSNVNFLRKFKPAAPANAQDTCAKNQCPTIIVTEAGDEYDARLD